MKMETINFSEITRVFHELDDAGVKLVEANGTIITKEGLKITPDQDAFEVTGNRLIKLIQDKVVTDELKLNYSIELMRNRK